MKGILDNIKTWDTKKKLVFATLVVISLASVILLITWAQAPTYQVLYSNLDPSDAGAIVAKLQEMKVPYKTTATGILVPSDRVYDLRLQLASLGLPQGGGVGFEIFDKVGFGTTEFVQKINLKRALQGELARTIKSLQEVEDCRVHLSIPERSIFVTQEEAPKASVLLKLHPGLGLTKRQIAGIVHLVASSVEGLTPENVTVVDSRGNILNAKEDEIASLTTSQIEYQRSIEKELEKRVIGILEPVVGKGKVRAKASVQIDFTRKEQTQEIYDPDGQVVRSQQKLIEQKALTTPEGVPGVQSNLPGRNRNNTSIAGTGSVKKTETINYEISKIVSHIVNPVGEIKKLSIAVIVDGNYVKDEKTGKIKYVARTEEEIANYEELIKKAVGFSEQRGDEIKVINMPFKIEKEEIPESTGPDYTRYIIPAARYGTILILSLLAFFFLIRPLMSYLKSQPKRMPAAREGARATAPGELEAQPVRKLPPSDEVIEWARNNPQVAANIIRKWMEEE